MVVLPQLDCQGSCDAQSPDCECLQTSLVAFAALGELLLCFRAKDCALGLCCFSVFGLKWAFRLAQRMVNVSFLAFLSKLVLVLECLFR